MHLPIVPALLASASPAALADQPPIAVEQVQPATAPDLAPEGPAADAPPVEQEPVEQLPAEQLPIEQGDVIIVEGAVGPPPGDPAIQVNETVFNISQDVDQAIVGPVAAVYEDDIPKPLRNGLRNFLRNMLEPVNALNYLLQLNPGKAIETLARFAINTTVGIGGLVDMASREPFNLPWRRNGLANTLGYYGVGPGPYLVLPLVGATTLRDLVGSTVDQSIVPFAVGAPLNTPYYAIPAYTVNSLQFRMEFDETMEQIRDSIDPYEATREYYLCTREAEIAALRDRPPPRDCRIAALMGELDEEVVAAAPDLPVAPEPIPQAAPAPVQAPAPAPELAPEPEIVFVSTPVVQGQ